MSELPLMPSLGDYLTGDLGPVYESESISLRAYLKRAMEYAGHKWECKAAHIGYRDAPKDCPCTCGLDAFRAFLREQGVGE